MLKTLPIILLLGVFFIAITSCEKKATPPETSSKTISEEVVPLEKQLALLDSTIRLREYNMMAQRVLQRQEVLKGKAQSTRSIWQQYALMNEAKTYALTTLTDSIFPHWYGTVWDYNGVTQQPQTGQIACGYFVTTTLKHAGFKLQRKVLAQQAAMHIINSLCEKESIHIIGGNDFKQLCAYMHQCKDGLYIIGLDNHVGFLQVKGTEVFAIHASGIPSLNVIKERLEDAKIIQKSKLFVIGNLTENVLIMKKWLFKEKIATIIK
jgi:hypothetical protein